jgi:hypothetical protein
MIPEPRPDVRWTLDKSRFAIVDVVADTAARNAHLAGRVAAGLMTHADGLFAQTPQIRSAELMAASPALAGRARLIADAWTLFDGL